MNCRDIKDLLVVGTFGSLTVQQKNVLDVHLRDCPGCARLAERIPLRPNEAGSETDIPLPDWEKAWEVIESRSFGRRRPFLGRALRWAPAAAGLILVFAFGYLAGRRVLLDHELRSSQSWAETTISALSWADYAERVKPVLVDFLNRGDVRPPEELVEIKRRVIRDMLLQTRLLKSLAAEARDARLGDLLLDLEFILTSLANLDSQDDASATHLEGLIRERDLSLRLSDLSSQTSY